MNRTARVVSLAALATLMLAPTAGAAARFGGVAVAERRDDGGTEIVRLGLDGSATALTAPAERAGRPKLSYDGRRVVYQAVTATGSEIWVMHADGTAKRQVTRLGGLATHPAISPDLKRVVFTYRARTGDAPQLYSIPTAGGRAKRLTWGGRGSSEADLSPDGRTIAYTAWPSNAARGLTRIFLMNADGTVKRKLSAQPIRRPDFSPDGTKVVFELADSEGRAAWEPTGQSPGYQFGTIGADGRGFWRESWYDERSWHAEPIWAPDSTRVLIRFHQIAYNWTLVVMTPGGSHHTGAGEFTQVSPDEYQGYGNADWAPGPN
jgi:Tol biopolymer transport system component